MIYVSGRDLRHRNPKNVMVADRANTRPSGSR